MACTCHESNMYVAHAPESKIDIKGETGYIWPHMYTTSPSIYRSCYLAHAQHTLDSRIHPHFVCLKPCMRVETMAAVKKEQSNILPTDEEPIASLLDPEREIPPDIHFEIHDETGTMQGVLGGHKNLMALRSPVFKTMFFGALTEKGDTVQIKDTSLVAFKALLKHIHDDKKEDDWQKMDIGEVARIADIAERYHLPGLKTKTVEYAKNYSLPKGKLLETFCLAELVPHPEFSKALLHNCEDFLLTILGTPRDYNKFMKENSKDIAAFRLLSRINHSEMAFVNTEFRSVRKQEAVTCIRNIKRSIRPRHYLRKLIKVVKTVQDSVQDATYTKEVSKDFLEDFRSIVILQTQFHSVTVNSLKKTMEWDAEQAAEKGTPLTWNTRVGDNPGVGGNLTYKKSVEMHLKLMQETQWKGWWRWEVISIIWGLIVSPKSLSEAKESLFKWLSTNFVSLDKKARVKLLETLYLCSDALKDVPGYDGFHKTCLEHADYDSSDDSDSSDSDSSDSDSDD